MSARQGSQPITGDLVRLIRETAKCDGSSLQASIRHVEERQNKEVEFYLRACAVRLEHCL